MNHIIAAAFTDELEKLGFKTTAKQMLAKPAITMKTPRVAGKGSRVSFQKPKIKTQSPTSIPSASVRKPVGLPNMNFAKAPKGIAPG